MLFSDTLYILFPTELFGRLPSRMMGLLLIFSLFMAHVDIERNSKKNGDMKKCIKSQENKLLKKPLVNNNNYTPSTYGH